MAEGLLLSADKGNLFDFKLDGGMGTQVVVVVFVVAINIIIPAFAAAVVVIWVLSLSLFYSLGFIVVPIISL